MRMLCLWERQMVYAVLMLCLFHQLIHWACCCHHHHHRCKLAGRHLAFSIWHLAFSIYPIDKYWFSWADECQNTINRMTFNSNHCIDHCIEPFIDFVNSFIHFHDNLFQFAIYLIYFLSINVWLNVMFVLASLICIYILLCLLFTLFCYFHDLWIELLSPFVWVLPLSLLYDRIKLKTGGFVVTNSKRISIFLCYQ